MKLNNPTPSQILRYIETRPEHADKTKTYIILGRIGATGKTWLCDQLKARGYNAMEITEQIYDQVVFCSSVNEYSEHEDLVVIVLNSSLHRSAKTE